MNIRIPAWCQAISSPDDQYSYLGRPEKGAAAITLNGRNLKYEMARGYARIRRRWAKGDTIDLKMDMPARRVKANERVEADRGRVALLRGPIVYCLESADNPEGVNNFFLPPDFDPELKVVHRNDLLGGVDTLVGKAQRRVKTEAGVITQPATFTAIPYYANCNRGGVDMLVWLPEKPEMVSLP